MAEVEEIKQLILAIVIFFLGVNPGFHESRLRPEMIELI
jgi:hypothetical protein